MYTEPTFFLRKNTKGNNTFDFNTYDYKYIYTSEN